MGCQASQRLREITSHTLRQLRVLKKVRRWVIGRGAGLEIRHNAGHRAVSVICMIAGNDTP